MTPRTTPVAEARFDPQTNVVLTLREPLRTVLLDRVGHGDIQQVILNLIHHGLEAERRTRSAIPRVRRARGAR